ncbi:MULTISPECIES: 3-hydroxyacyl-CoA dehydrogenase/enoyl-CoA hydratase family protein [unclassified Thalassospira]|uniref:3-hydroxyacyl-CoA dehydrogenase/enoyl-CoA hydratase family protein n=1 Tax=unclassified Thalassospira TaxID=2648997 RepID=UPI0018CE3731|nr:MULTISPECIES: 3-hydroxyacyl-CoA dehydrogenase/enoyl-CoA hydratase family protein [unclassified Thalassospira]QPO11655.1 3-hydroxyacyl-CoA dehydrogenase [Thalassospira sp. A40-3]|tara:strand:+ start:6617 stop:8941 length:2325 start_codon:yes stop_codon:yes gene_type:complete
MTTIKQVAVIGAGVMGAAIAAHIANSGTPVLLLDIVPEGAKNRNSVAEGAVAKMLKTDPAPFMSKRVAKLITCGNIEDDLDKIAKCDWVIEAVIERLDIKQDLYRKIDAVRAKGSVVSSNTSTIPLATLIDGMDESFAQDFIITHFFNPPRYMRLLELVGSGVTRDGVIDGVADFADRKLGKTCVTCHDEPGFIANRLGVYWIQAAMVEAMDRKLTVEEADSVIGRPFGIPKTGVFGLMDLVGLDLMPHVQSSMAGLLDKSDPFHAIYRESDLVSKLIADGYTGRKGKGGFYRLNRDGGQKVKESVDLQTGKFAKSEKARLGSVRAAGKDPRKMMEASDKGGQYGRAVMGKTLAYAAFIAEAASNSIVDVDDAMKLGYAWKTGPFELIDAIGVDVLISMLEEDGVEVPALLKKAAGKSFYKVEDGDLYYLGFDGEYAKVTRPDGVILLEDIKRISERIAGNRAASLWDIGDGVACLEFHTKMNALDADVLGAIKTSIRTVKKQFKAMVIYNEASNFSAGANLGLALFAANIAAWSEIENLVETGQETYKALKYSPFPVVGAPSGLALGGGCEVLLHCDAVQAHGETYIGLVEPGVGLIPAWGGCKEMIRRWAENPKFVKGPMAPSAKAFEIISVATVAKSAMEAKENLFFRETDGITMNRNRLLADAKERALSMVDGYEAPEEFTYRLPGEAARVAFEMAVDGFHRLGKATDYDRVVAGELAKVLAGGDTDVTEELSEDDILELEREGFMRLVRNEGTMARVEHMLLTGKPLRN